MNNTTNQKSKSNKLVNSSSAVSVILLLYMFVDLLRFFNIIPLFLGNASYVLLGSIALIYSVYKNGIKKQIPILIFILFYNIFGALGILFSGNMNPQELLWPFAFIGLATIILNFKIDHKLAKGMFYFVVILLMTQIIVSSGVNNLNIVGSRNTIGIMVLFYFSIYAIASFKHRKKITIYPVIIGLLATVMAIGRSGILTFILLTVLFFPFVFDGKKHKIRNPIKSLFVLIVGSSVFWISYNLLEFYFAEMYLNYQNRGLESIRFLIWGDYLNKTYTSAGYFLFGTPISGTIFLNMYSENLHNSFLMLHAKYGLMPLIVVIALIFKSFIHFIKTKNVLYFIILSAIVFRMQFDYTNFNAQLDIILYYFIFTPYIKIKYM